MMQRTRNGLATSALCSHAHVRRGTIHNGYNIQPVIPAMVGLNTTLPRGMRHITPHIEPSTHGTWRCTYRCREACGSPKYLISPRRSREITCIQYTKEHTSPNIRIQTISIRCNGLQNTTQHNTWGTVWQECLMVRSTSRSRSRSRTPPLQK